MLASVTHSDWNRILDQATADNARRAAEKKYDQLSLDDVQHLRKRCKTDLFFLTRAILGYDKLTAGLHLHLCRWLAFTSEHQFRLVLLPRGHYKTTICTISNSIQMALPDVIGGCSYPRNLGPNIRIMLGHETADGASRFLFEITSHFCDNPLLMGLFPECIPSKRYQRMNQEKLDLPREAFWAEPTFDTMGVGAKSQGRHYEFIDLDDIFGIQARDSEAERRTTIEWFDNIQSFFVSLRQSHMDIKGTRYSSNDVYARALDAYGPRLKRYIRRVEEKQSDGAVKPIFPEEFPSEALTVLRKNPKVWIQYSNDPMRDFREFDPAWKRYYYWIAENKIAVFQGDSKTQYNVRDLDLVILVDPSVTGSPGIIVTGTNKKLQIFLLETYKKPTRPPEFIELIFKLVQKWWPRLVSIEEVVFSAVYKPWLEREMGLRGVRFNIYPYKPPRRMMKPERIKGLSTYFSAGQVFGNELQTEFWDEYDTFGTAEEGFHLLDALAQGPEVWRPGLDRQQWEQYKQMEQDVLGDRDILTGYSPI